MFQLVVQEEDRSLSFPLADGDHVVGSRSDCGIVLGHPTVSGHHARLTVAGESCMVEDLGSRNGTKIDGRAVVGTQAVDLGKRLSFGTQSARLEAVEVEDVALGVSFDVPASTGSSSGDPTPTDTPLVGSPTAASGTLDAFVLDYLPRILDGIDEECDGVPALCAAALFETLPCLRVEAVTSSGGLLYSAEREPADDVTTLETRGGDVTLAMAFAHKTQAEAFESVAECAARLISLASSRRAPAEPLLRGSRASPPNPPSLEPRVIQLYEQAEKVARGSVSVLITGESGTGKEVLARFLHAASSRSDMPLVTLNCAALPNDLLESELFGIESRVATGVDSRPGKFELADGGTLFLDEIGDMAAETQAKILRVLQEGEIYRVGGRQARNADVRIIAATNRDLDAMRADGSFRSDLYHRIADWTVEMPPLRSRSVDVPNLAAHFLSREGRTHGLQFAGISRAAVSRLQSFSWPGNVRQLEREMARAALFLGPGQVLQTQHLSSEIAAAEAPSPSDDGTLRAKLERVERAALAESLHRHAGNYSAASRELGIARSTLYRRLRELGLEDGDQDGQ